MTSFEIALCIRREHDSAAEDLRAFALRRFAKEKVRDVCAAVELLVSWEHAEEDFEKLIDLLKPVSAKAPPDAPLQELIKRKRALGYDAGLEAVLARRWRCPHCKQFSHIGTVEIPLGDPLGLWRCAICGGEGIGPVEPDAKLEVRDGGKSGLRPL